MKFGGGILKEKLLPIAGKCSCGSKSWTCSQTMMQLVESPIRDIDQFEAYPVIVNQCNVCHQVRLFSAVGLGFVDGLKQGEKT